MSIRTTVIRKNQSCTKCGNILLHGNEVRVKTYIKGRTVKREYFCLDCICTSCGNECGDNKYPEVVFKDKYNFICENCSIDYEEDKNGKITKRKEYFD